MVTAPLGKGIKRSCGEARARGTTILMLTIITKGMESSGGA